MIAYNLACAQGHEFEGWFKDSESYATQEAEGALVCPLCGDGHVRKGIMAPSVLTSNPKPSDNGPDGAGGDHRDTRTHQFVAGLRKFIKENAEYVGPRFPEEARKIHYGESEARHIFGESNLAEARALIEEGIDIAPVPPDPDDLN